MPKLTFFLGGEGGGGFLVFKFNYKKNLNSFHFRRDLWLENLSDFCCLAMLKRGPNTTFYVIFSYSKLVWENTSWNTLHCNKASFSYNQCVKYERIRVFSNPYFPVLKHNLQFWPYTGKFATEKTPFLFSLHCEYK